MIGPISSFSVKLIGCGFIFIIILLRTTHGYGYDSLKTGLALHQSAQYQKALPILINLAQKFKVQDDISNYARCQLKIADIIRNYGGANIALELLHANQKLMEVRLEKSTLELAQNYLAQAEALYAVQRLTEFKEAVLKSVSIKREMKLPEKYLAEDYLQLARYYKELPNQNDSCYYWVQQSLRLAKSDKSFSAYILPRIYNLIGYYYHPASNAYFKNKRDSLMRHYALSRRYYDSAMTAFKKQPLPDQLMEARIYHNLGNSYSNEAGVDNKLELLPLAIVYYRKSESAYERLGSPADLALKNWVIGKAYERLKLYDSAIHQFQKGITRLIPESENWNASELPPLQPTLHDSRFITLVTMKANNLLYTYRQNQDVKYLLSAYQHYEFLLKFNHYLLSRSQYEQEVTYWNYLYGSNAYQSLVITAYELFKKTNDKQYLTKSYGLIASAKYAWLNRNDIDPALGNSISSSVLKEELKLVKRILLQKVSGLTESDLNFIVPVIPEHKGIIPLGTINLSNQSLDTISVESLQQELSKGNEVLIDFYIWGSDLYSLVISENDFAVVKQILPSDFASIIYKLKQKLLTSRPSQYAQLANKIYMETLDSVLLHVPKEVDRLVICPDGNLQSLPWDALVEDTLHTVAFKTLHYLLHRFTIRTVITPRHLVSASLKKNGYVGIISDFTHSKRFSHIPFSSNLVRDKATALDGEVLSTIQNDSFHVNILHIASHVVNDSLRPYRSSIFFNDEDSITLAELSNSRIQPQLVILNGCQTGNGTYYQSEGTISFARAFYLMHAESVLMTLWSVDDKASADLLTLFYQEMERGNELDVSLREAKLNFVRNANTDELANPYYWAGLHLTGKADSVIKSYRTMVVYSGIGVFIFALLLLIIIRVKKDGVLLKDI